MRKLTILTLLAAALAAAGCSSNSCRQGGGMGGWFNHGDRCNPYPNDCPPGVPRTQMMIPSTTPVLPGTIDIAPQ
jgi:hypothetical protein